MNVPVLQIDNLSVRVVGSPAAQRVVENVSFDVRQGETLCVVGESGSGKSVTALSVMGLLPRGGLAPASGSILVKGENVLTASPRRLREMRATRMAMVFQEPMTALNPVEPVGKQIDEVLRVHSTLSKTSVANEFWACSIRSTCRIRVLSTTRIRINCRVGSVNASSFRWP